MISKLILHCQSRVRQVTHQPTHQLQMKVGETFFPGVARSVRLLYFISPFVNHCLGHLTKTHVGFSVGSIRATVSGAKRCHNESLLDCSCCRKIHLYFTPQLCREVMPCANKLLQMYVYVEMLEEKKIENLPGLQ